MAETGGSEAVKGPSSDEQRVIVVDPIDRYSAFIVRGTIIGTGLVGVALFLRHSRLFVRFDKASHIPEQVIRKELELKGKVKSVLPSGVLRVEHQPIVALPSALMFRRYKEPGTLSVRLAGVEVSKAGLDFLSKDLRLENKEVTFTIVKPTTDQPDTVDADVTLKKNRFMRTNLNVELIRKGYAKVHSPSEKHHVTALQTVPAYSRLVSKLLMSEKIAERRGVGVWQRDTWVESMAAYPSQVTQILKSSAVTRFALLVVAVSKDAALSGYHLSQQAYQKLLVICAYMVHVYRVFATAVDKMTLLYNNTKQKIVKK